MNDARIYVCERDGAADVDRWPLIYISEGLDRVWSDVSRNLVVCGASKAVVIWLFCAFPCFFASSDEFYVFLCVEIGKAKSGLMTATALKVSKFDESTESSKWKVPFSYDGVNEVIKSKGWEEVDAEEEANNDWLKSY